jgi:hypothetical protein
VPDAVAAMLDHDPQPVALQVRANQAGKPRIVFDQQDERRSR